MSPTEKENKWVFLEDTGCMTKEGTEVSIQCRRVRDPKTGKEALRIQVEKRGNKVCELDLSLINIEDELMRTREYGLFLSHLNIFKIFKLIKENYDLIKLVEDTNEDKLSKYFDDILVMINEYIAEGTDSLILKDGRTKAELCGIPVKEFRSIFEESDYYDIDQTELKKKLIENSLAVCNIGRLDKLMKKTVQRMVCGWLLLV